jgi:methionine-gamma-lyase
MAAISTTLLALLSNGDHVIAPNVMYQPTRWFLGKLLREKGVEVTFVDATKIEAYESAFQTNTKVAWVETPANPTLQLTDLNALGAWAKSRSLISVADNTFSTPMGTRPLTMGIDVVVHSATKYLAGHGDLLAGAIATRREIKDRILPWLDHLGSGLTAHGAWMLRRGISTFPVRFERHQSNATWIAEWLRTHSRVSNLHYPALADNPQRDIYVRQMSGGGGVVSFEIDGGEEAAFEFLRALKICAIARSLGEPRTLVAHPWSMHYAAISPGERQEAGVSASLIRVAVGLENPSDIYCDIEQALDSVSSRGLSEVSVRSG